MVYSTQNRGLVLFLTNAQISAIKICPTESSQCTDDRRDDLHDFGQGWRSVRVGGGLTLPLTPPKYTYISCSLEVGSRVRVNVLHLRKCINHLHRITLVSTNSLILFLFVNRGMITKDQNQRDVFYECPLTEVCGHQGGGRFG
jgi:hypothetical protein